MNSCCVRPVEIIAADLHKVNYTCCMVTEQTSAPARAKCPVSDTLSRKVQHRTVEHLVKHEKKSLIRDVQYYYCTDPNCAVVYFSNQDAPCFAKDDIVVKVLTKDGGDDVNVCYCFGWTRERLRSEIEQTGKSTAALSIANEIKAGKCNCDIKNPKGECCVGDVHTEVKQLLFKIQSK